MCLITVLFLSLFISLSAQATLNRKDVVQLVKGIDADFESGKVRVHINDFANEQDPGVLVGDTLSYSIASRNARYLLLVLVDPKGAVSVVFPDFLVHEHPETYQRFNYPPEGTGSLSQGEPVGIESVIVIASTLAIKPYELGFSDDSDIQSLGRNECDPSC